MRSERTLRNHTPTKADLWVKASIAHSEQIAFQKDYKYSRVAFSSPKRYLSLGFALGFDQRAS